MFSRLVIAGAAAAMVLGTAALSSPASAQDAEFQVAQYWGPPPPPPPNRWGPPPPPPPRWGHRPPPGYGYGPPPRRWGRACYTSRGTCGLGGRAPIGEPCRCYFPGFGPKRGNVI
ncbi:hypothetical protein [Blastochloris tepida]|uniref:Uncharacterized protein n=1 Tax=Blastochloris tepida TaxID=2233851 RepID=A0A348G0F0_9HYPH|nr:hypothetical protein [Blastochloris tepida]BBF93033.1 hypothetical protein BLTE_17180 [Blastochloris tepida]